MSWTREVVGWVLIACGLWAFWVCYATFLSDRKVFEAGPMAFVGFIIFRGGIHLLKVAVAARVCQTPTEPKSRPAVAPTRQLARPEKRPVRRPARTVISQD